MSPKKAQLNINLFGGVTFYIDQKIVAGFRSRTAEALLIYVAAQGQPVARNVLMALFWPESSPEQASNNFRRELSRIKKALGDFLVISRHIVGLDTSKDITVDAVLYKQAMAQHQPLLSGRETLTPDRAESLYETVQSKKGDLLAGFSLKDNLGFEEWLLMWREQLNMLTVTAWRRLSDYYLETGEYDRGIKCATAWVQYDELDERAHRHLMWFFLRTGRKHLALKQYEKCRHFLQQELNIDPSPLTQTVYQRVRKTTTPPRLKMPASSIQFVGREQEIHALHNLLLSHDNQLITILASGGMGKTSLAQHASRKLAQNKPGTFLDGIFFIPLENVTNSSQIAGIIADRLALNFAGISSPEQQLAQQLKEQELLLILDNFEHLIDRPSLTLIATILREAPAVKLLITSRQRLGLLEEILFDLTGLPFPENKDLANIESYDAVRLFIDTACRLNRSFSPTTEDMNAIIALCQFVEGMPLGIELAASGIRYATCKQLLKQLKERLDFEFSHAVNRVDRHRNLYTVFEHSWHLLKPAEQNTVAKLAVLQAAFDSSAIAAVTNASPSQIMLFTDKSFLRQVKTNQFDLHPLLHQFLAEKLNSHPEAKEQAAAAHAHHFFLQMKNANTNEQNMELSYHSILEYFGQNHDNLAAAMKWFASQPDPDKIFFDRHHGYLSELLQRLSFYSFRVNNILFGQALFSDILIALEQNPAAQEDYALPMLTFVRHRIGYCAFLLHNYPAAKKHIEATLGDGVELSVAYNILGMIAGRGGDFMHAFNLFEKAISEASDRKETHLYPILEDYAQVALDGGFYTLAKQKWEQMHELAKSVHATDANRAIYETGLGQVALQEKKFATAKQHLRAGLNWAQRMEQHPLEKTARLNLAMLALETNKLSQATKFLDKAFILAKTPYDIRFTAQCHLVAGRLARVTGDVAKANTHISEAITLLDQIQDLSLLPIAVKSKE